MTRFSDDGEPSGTAGQPILDVLRKQNIVKSAIVVTRYFGGIKLGAGGLVGAYSDTASKGVKAGKISQKVQCAEIEINADYPTFAVLDKYIRKSGAIFDCVEYGQDVECKVFVPDDGVDAFVSSVRELSGGKADVIVTGNKEYKCV